ncbi:MAG: hypothetical protein HYU69_15965 [Bacteroidetes bacterium]|nr:hypothetical protein [Bacteroidota bacterium]
MKTKRSELFDLIKSLNRQEKKRVRKELSSNRADKTLLMLYDIIDKQKVFDDALVQKKSGYPKWYPQLKKYLFEKISDKVFGGYYDKKQYTYVLKLIIMAEQYKTKGIIRQTQKMLEQASAICRDNEWFEYLPIINTKLNNFLDDNYLHRANHSFYPKAYKELNQSYLEKKYTILFRCIEFSNNSVESAMVINDIIIDECLSDEKYLTSYRQKLDYYLFLASYYKNIALNYPQCYFHCKKYLEVSLEFQSKKIRKEHDSDRQKYLRGMSIITGSFNVIISAINANYLEDLDEQFHSLIQLEEKFKVKKKYTTNKLFFIETLQLAYFQITTAKITRRGFESSDFNSYLKRYYLLENKLSPRISTICNELIALCFFMKEKWNDCSSMTNKILNDSELYKNYPETYANILLLTLFVNYEKGDLDILDYNLRKAERYFENHYSALGYEKMILLFFNEIVLNHYTNSKVVMKKYKNKLHHLLLNDRQFSLTYLTERAFIDFESWLESEIRDRPFIDVIKEKARKK